MRFATKNMRNAGQQGDVKKIAPHLIKVGSDTIAKIDATEDDDDWLMENI